MQFSKEIFSAFAVDSVVEYLVEIFKTSEFKYAYDAVNICNDNRLLLSKIELPSAEDSRFTI